MAKIKVELVDPNDFGELNVEYIDGDYDPESAFEEASVRVEMGDFSVRLRADLAGDVAERVLRAIGHRRP